MAVSIVYQSLVNGGVSYFGNAIGLTKSAGSLTPGTVGAVGAFMTVDSTTAAAGGWPNGTTLDWKYGSSSAYVDINSNDTIEKAYLFWGATPRNAGNDLGNVAYKYPIYLVTPDGTKNTFDPQYSMLTASGSYSNCVDVTTIVSTFGAGNYTCGSIPCSLVPTATVLQGGGWFLAVVTKNPTSLSNYVTLCLTNDTFSQVGTNIPIITPMSGSVTGLMMVSTINAMATNGDALIFSSTSPFVAPNRNFNNFFGSLISNNSGDGLPYTNATFGNNNNSLPTNTNITNGRQGIDLAIFPPNGAIPTGVSSYYFDGYVGPSLTPYESNFTYLAYGSSLNPSNAITKLTKSVNKDFAYKGETLIYTLNFVLEGSGTVNNLRVYDTLPDNTSFISNSVYINGVNSPSANLTTGINFGTTITLPYSGTITYSVTINNSGTFNDVSNSFYTTFTNPISNGTIFLNTVVSAFAVTTIINSANINTQKQVSKTYGTLNDIITYTITYNNTGSLDATNTSFIDTLPSGVTLVPNSLYVNGSLVTATNPISISLGTVNSNTSGTISFNAQVSGSLPNPNPIINQGLINYNYTSNGILTSVSTITNNVVTTINYGSLNSNKSVNYNYAQIGDILTYTIAVSYSYGNASLFNVTLIDTLPSAISLVSNSLKINGVVSSGSLNSPGLTLPTLPVSGITTVTFNATVQTVPNPNPLSNSALINYSYLVDPSLPATNSFSATPIVQTTIVKAAPNLIKYVDKAFTTIGETITYTLVLTNNSNISITNAIFVDTIATALTFIQNSLTINGISTTNTPANIPLGTLTAGQVVTIVYKAILN